MQQAPRTRLRSAVPARHLDAQALRTQPHRHHVWQQAGLGQAMRVLDVGCGNGAVTADLQAWLEEAPPTQGRRMRAPASTVVGVDLDPGMAHASRGRGITTLCADGGDLPFGDASFDAAVCHLTLLWAAKPARTVAEMARVVRPGGIVVAAMEPDFGAKVHHPENPLVDMVWKGLSIKRRGGDPHAGRRLRSHFVAAGLHPTVAIANPEVLTPDQDLAMWRRDRMKYRRELAAVGFPAASIDAWEEEYVASLCEGTQLSWFPLFYAWARKTVPGDVEGP